MNKKYYHITDPKNLIYIAIEGLKANDEGHIFLFDWLALMNKNTGKTMLIADSIACNQVFLEEYLLLQINPRGIKTALIPDNVAELTNKNQWIAHQRKIYPSYIKVMGIRKIDRMQVTEFYANLFGLGLK